MASQLPIPAPPRTPTPPPDESSPSKGFGPLGLRIDGICHANVNEPLYDPRSLSPADPNAHFGPMSTNMASPVSPSSIYSTNSWDGGKSDVSNPFNFQTAALAKSPVVKSVRHLRLFASSPFSYITEPY